MSYQLQIRVLICSRLQTLAIHNIILQSTSPSPVTHYLFLSQSTRTSSMSVRVKDPVRSSHKRAPELQVEDLRKEQRDLAGDIYDRRVRLKTLMEVKGFDSESVSYY